MDRGLTWRVRIVEEQSGGIRVLIVAGRLGSRAAGDLADVINRQGSRLIVDLSGVDYISSAGLNLLDGAARQCQAGGGAVVLAGVSEPVRIALDLAGLLDRVATAPSRADAVERFLRDGRSADR